MCLILTQKKLFLEWRISKNHLLEESCSIVTICNLQSQIKINLTFAIDVLNSKGQMVLLLRHGIQHQKE